MSQPTPPEGIAIADLLTSFNDVWGTKASPHEFVTVLDRQWCMCCQLFQSRRGPSAPWAPPHPRTAPDRQPTPSPTPPNPQTPKHHPAKHP